MVRIQPLRAAPRSLYICQTCRHARPQLPSSSRSSPQQTTRSITRVHVEKIKRSQEEWRERSDLISSGQAPSMLSRLEERGYINQIVGPRDDLENLLTMRRIGVYAGIDPTAPSMHLGHLIPFMALAFFYIHGYSVHYLLGGFTASIGDPTGRLTGRAEQSPGLRKTNMASLHNQLKRFMASVEKYAERRGYLREWAWRKALTNNAAWWSKTTARDFLFVLGRHVRLGPMLGRDTVKNRLDGDGMSFSEFSYPLVQAYDWWHLFQQGVQLQIGGADQFGNILTGTELIKSIAKEDHPYQTALRDLAATERKSRIRTTNDPFGFTVPLLTTVSGEKFGKSAGNAVWLDESMTSPFELYQFLLRSADADVEKFLRLLTFVPLEEIKGLMEQHEQDASKRIPHHKLAKEIVELIHGLGAADKAEAEHRGLYGKAVSVNGILQTVDTQKKESSKGNGKAGFINPQVNKHAQPLSRETTGTPHIQLPRSLVIGQPLSRICWSAGLTSSKSEAQRLISAAGLYIGANADAKGGMDDALSFTPAKSASWDLLERYIIDEKLLILRVGKWKMKIINIVSDTEFAQSGQTCPGWDQKVEDAPKSS
ncbi:uncharacterized protein A1O9_10216 [Exophiala aquamarina CBS 119918]|uniref:Tyrosine--tRNA ligase n=1 Tax=Exophiala aquamarina CBS 119918 TaxID=1182545 RepID=A0A072PE54_9EURO|nr:uncharacterized protein A1O9_10216 [Exophiala aquamarina CBS 119918]KEF53815.1 hypothetical protein A1O9_10216 [Exophiala aquamarina CBS 119918]